MIRENTVIWNDLEEIVTDPIFDEIAGGRFLISGATGFVGYYLIEALANAARKKNTTLKIYAIVRNIAKGIEKFKELYQDGYIEFIEQDISEPIKLDQAVDYVIHMASNAAPREYLSMPVETMKINFMGTNHMLEYAKNFSVKRFIYISTIEVYGSGHGEETIGESDYGIVDSLNVRSCYPISKKAAETLSISYMEAYGVPVIIGRLSYLFGPGMGATDSKVVAQFTRDAVAGKNIVLKSKGLQKRTYCYISDAVRGILYVLGRGENGNAYNITNGSCITTIAGIAETIAEIEQENNIQVKYELPSETEKKRFSLVDDAVMSTRKINQIGFEAKIDLRTGLYRMLNSLREG